MKVADRKVVAWALYDWGNSAFATTVMAGFFPVFFKQYWSFGSEAAVSTFRLGVANSVASVLIVLIAPVLGAIADAGGARKKFLLFFAMMGIAMTGGLYFLAQGNWPAAMLLYALAVVGFSGGNVFYDALIMDVAGPRRVDVVSALGYVLGYLGGGLLFAFNVAMTRWPEWFGLADVREAVRLSFLMVAGWWAVFTVPLLVAVKEQAVLGCPGGARETVRAGLRRLAVTLGRIRRLRVVALFLAAYWLYIDGVDTIVRMAVDYGMALGFDASDLVLALLVTQFVGFPAAIAFGCLGERIGAKNGIFLAIGVYGMITVWAFFMDGAAEFYGIAVAIGLVQGGIQSLSRSFYTRIIPRGMAAEFFGFYNMLGKFAAVVGPLLMGSVGLVTGDPRFSVLSLLLLFALGALLLWRVDEQAGRRMAAEMERA